MNLRKDQRSWKGSTSVELKGTGTYRCWSRSTGAVSFVLTVEGSDFSTLVRLNLTGPRAGSLKPEVYHAYFDVKMRIYNAYSHVRELKYLWQRVALRPNAFKNFGTKSLTWEDKYTAEGGWTPEGEFV